MPSSLDHNGKLMEDQISQELAGEVGEDVSDLLQFRDDEDTKAEDNAWP